MSIQKFGDPKSKFGNVKQVLIPIYCINNQQFNDNLKLAYLEIVALLHYHFKDKFAKYINKIKIQVRISKSK